VREKAGVQNKGLDIEGLLDGLGQGVLVFDSSNKLVAENRAARTFLGADLRLVRAEGWNAAAILFDTRQNDPDKAVDNIRAQALDSDRPVRFHIYRQGEHIPCWATAVPGKGGEVYTMITIEIPDWSALSEILSKYLVEVRDAIDSTRGHANLIAQTTKRPKANDTIETVGRRVTGFTRLIDIHMHRLGALTDLMERLEQLRTGRLRDGVRTARRRIVLADFFEDFLEEIDDSGLVDPESDSRDHRRRIKTNVPDSLVISASPTHLLGVLRDLLRNAIMYSMKAAPVQVVAHASAKDNMVQIDVIDEGYGIRSSESERVFQPFTRGRQPQIMSEFGYGLSLYLCKHEVEAMNGRLWFESEEGVGTTFSLKLPTWREQPAPELEASRSSP
jgi:signal transduction histidine kinase